MTRRYSVPLCAVIFGVLLAVLEWRIHASGSLTLLVGAIAIGLAVLALCARTYPIHEKWRFEEYFAGDDTMLKLHSVLGGLLFALGGIAIIIISVLTDSVSLFTLPQLTLGVLAVGSLPACILLAKVQARGEIDAKNAQATLVLLVWASMYLIVLFKSNNTNPYLYTYVSTLLGGVALTLAFLFYARFLYGKIMPRAFLFCAGAAVMLIFASAGSYALTSLFPIGDAEPSLMLHYAYHVSALGSAVYLVGQMVRMNAPRKQTYYWQDP